MSEWKLFTGRPPEFTRPEWYADRERAPHLEQPDHGDRLKYTALRVRMLARKADAGTIVDLGCGDGGMLTLLEGLDAWGYDLCPANVKAARAERDVPVTLLDVVAHPERVVWGDLAVCTEMLEHLADPHAFVREVGKRCRAIVASSPVNEDSGAHYEFHAWAWDQDGYRALIEQAGFRIFTHSVVRDYQVISGIRDETAWEAA